VMFSQRGVMHLAHTEHDLKEVKRRLHANRLNGVDSEFLTTEQVKAQEPHIDTSPNARYPILGASIQRRAGTARHDAVAWGYARAANQLGVDIIQNCEVTGIDVKAGKVQGVQTGRGPIRCSKLALVAAGHSSVLADMAGFRLPIESFPLQALVSEPVKPCVNSVIMSNAVHGYISQSDKGELVIGAGTDQYVSYAQRGSFHIVEHTLQAIVELFPCFSRMRMLRQWGGIVDVTPDRSPILGTTPVENLFINCGWGTGGFKATPGSAHVFAHTVAKGEPHPINAPFTLERFSSGQLVDEHGAAAVAH
jgi:sarcosine oxidase subunit beta